MREHPIPQDITGYKFHIIGNMTLKQFAELGAGALLGLILYSTNLPFFLKWPLIFVAIGTGAAAAFLPFEERPLDHWIMTFVRIMYRPTKYFWQREEKIPAVFSYTSNDQPNTNETLDLTPARRDRIREYLASVPTSDVSEDPFAQAEMVRLQEIMQAFQTIQPKTVSATHQAHKPELVVKVRSLKKSDGLDLGTDDSVTVFDQKQREPMLTKHQKSIEEVALNIVVPDNEAIEVERQQQQTIAAAKIAEQNSVYMQASNATTSDTTSDQAATFNEALPFPSKPTEPNKLVGMILTQHNELIPDAIVEVRDQDNRVVRAVKSNALGQFFVTTPLKSGQYTIAIEHDNYQFPTFAVTLQDEAVDPLEVRSLG